jgi:sorbitol-specific phosphotransferase system component IIBC
MFPFPAGIDPANTEALKQAVANLPARAFVLVVIGWAVATFCGAWLAARLASRAPAVHGGVVTVMLVAAGILNMLDLPHPTWVWITGLAAFIIGGAAGTRIGGDRSRPNPRPSNAQVAPA